MHEDMKSPTPIITFDQPFWWKALIHQIHTELECIGHLMASSGLLELIYAPNAVVHMWHHAVLKHSKSTYAMMARDLLVKINFVRVMENRST